MLGKDYIDNHQYSSKVKACVWKDERYTVVDSLIEDATAKLAEISKPYRQYTAEVQDLAKQSEVYKDILAYGIGDTVTTADGLRGEVHSVNVLRQTVKVIVVVDKDEKEIREYKVDQLKFKPRRKKGKGGEKQDEAELKKLEALEKREGKSRLNDK